MLVKTSKILTQRKVLRWLDNAWDMITMYDQATASGLYLYTVEDQISKNKRRKKFLLLSKNI